MVTETIKCWILDHVSCLLEMVWRPFQVLNDWENNFYIARFIISVFLLLCLLNIVKGRIYGHSEFAFWVCSILCLLGLILNFWAELDWAESADEDLHYMHFKSFLSNNFVSILVSTTSTLLDFNRRGFPT